MIKYSKVYNIFYNNLSSIEELRSLESCDIEVVRWGISSAYGEY